MKYLIKNSILAAILGIAMISCDLIETTYTVRFDSKGGTPTPQEQTVKEGGKVTKPADPTLENFNFVGWAKADSETSALWNFDTETVTEDMTLFARWTLITHAVSFNSDGGSTVTAQNVAHGGVAAKPADPTRSGFEFDGWFNGETEWSFANSIIAPITLKAKWTAVHVVTFDSDNGSAISTQNVRNGGTATEPEDPTRDGFEFDGWFNSDVEWNFATAITASITLTAKWTAVHTVIFDSNGGSEVPAQNIRNGNAATKPADPIRTITSGLYLGMPDINYTFEGWYKGETLWNFDNDVVIAPITLIAKWSLAGDATRIESVLSNNVAAAVAHINNNAGTYTLLISADVSVSATQTLNLADRHLTIRGLGGDRKITCTTTRLFTLNNANASLTIGENITLDNNTLTISSGNYLVYVQAGSLIMRAGSKITAYGGGSAIYVTGTNSRFTMEGGEISDNRILSNIGVGARTGCVFVTANAAFFMSGGRITNNTAQNPTNVADVYIDNNAATFTLSGTAEIGVVKLYKDGASNSSITIGAGGFSGIVSAINLRAYSSNTNQSTSNVINQWTAEATVPSVIKEVTNASVFNRFTLGRFISNSVLQTPQDIVPAYRLVLIGNEGKLQLVTQ